MLKKDVVFILGVARSGTSALTRTLSLCGCTLPSSVLGAAAINPRGIWEPVGALKLNRDFLSRCNVLGDPSFRLHSEITVDETAKERFVGEIQTFLRECPRAPALVIKEPTLPEVAGFWLEAAHREGFTPKAIVAFRHPGEVFQSQAAMMKSGSPPIEYLAAMWLKQALLAELHSRSLPRVFVEYSNLLRDWRRQIARVSQALTIDLDARGTLVDDFLTSQLYTQRRSGPITETFGNSWITTVYTTFGAAAEDRPLATPLLDEIRDTYRASERAFRISWECFRKMLSPDSIDCTPVSSISMPVWESGRDF